MVDQIGQIASGQEEMRQYLASNPWQQPEAEPEAQQDEGLDLSWLDPNAQQYEDPAQVAQRLNDQISGAVEQRVQALTDPMREQMAEMRRDQQARDLAAEFPEIATDEMANQIAGPGGLAAQMADQLGQPGLAAEPSLLAARVHGAQTSRTGEQRVRWPGSSTVGIRWRAGPRAANQRGHREGHHGIRRAGLESPELPPVSTVRL
jgi:hypothetical protein